MHLLKILQWKRSFWCNTSSSNMRKKCYSDISIVLSITALPLLMLQCRVSLPSFLPSLNTSISTMCQEIASGFVEGSRK